MKTQGILGFENVEQNTLQGSMFKGFPNQKSKMSQGEEGEGSEVYIDLPCERQKKVPLDFHGK